VVRVERKLRMSVALFGIAVDFSGKQKKKDKRTGCHRDGGLFSFQNGVPTKDVLILGSNREPWVEWIRNNN
jgi:hypothetical protein